MGKEESLSKGKECAKALWQLGHSTCVELQKCMCSWSINIKDGAR